MSSQQRSGSAALAGSTRPAGAWVFGKLPAHGDFIVRGLSPDLHEAFDLWLSAELARARARFPDFEERYRLAPAWHFVDRDPNGAWSGGALCASVDAVGRSFPVLLAAPAAGPEDAAGTALAALELVFTALAEGWNAARLHVALEGVVPLPAPPAEPGWAIEAEDGARIEIPGRFPDGLIERMLELAA